MFPLKWHSSGAIPHFQTHPHEKSLHYIPLVSSSYSPYLATFGWMNILTSSVRWFVAPHFLQDSDRCVTERPLDGPLLIDIRRCLMHLAPPSLHVLEISQTWSNMIKIIQYLHYLWVVIIIFIIVIYCDFDRLHKFPERSEVLGAGWFAAMLHCKARPHQDADRITGSLQPSIPKPIGP